MRDEDPKTMWAIKIKRSNKRFLQDLIRALIILFLMGLFFTTCWGIDKLVKNQQQWPM